MKHQSKIWFCWIYGLITHPVKSNGSTLWPCRAPAMKFEMMAQTFLQYNSWLVHDRLLTEILSMHKWDYNQRRSWLLWSVIQYPPLLQAASWHFFQANVDLPSLTNDTGVDCIDRPFAAVFLSAEDFSLTGLLHLLSTEPCALPGPLWALLAGQDCSKADLAVMDRAGAASRPAGAVFHGCTGKGWLECSAFISFKWAELLYFPPRYNNY